MRSAATLAALLFTSSLFAAAASAQVVLQSFSAGVDFLATDGSWKSTNLSFETPGVLTIGGNAVNDGSISFATTFGDWSQFDHVDLVIRSNPGNSIQSLTFFVESALDFSQELIDFMLPPTSVSGFTVLQIDLDRLSQGTRENVALWGISAGGSVDNRNLRISLDTVLLQPIPEPSTYVAIAGVAVLGLALWRRRR